MVTVAADEKRQLFDLDSWHICVSDVVKQRATPESRRFISRMSQAHEPKLVYSGPRFKAKYKSVPSWCWATPVLKDVSDILKSSQENER